MQITCHDEEDLVEVDCRIWHHRLVVHDTVQTAGPNICIIIPKHTRLPVVNGSIDWAEGKSDLASFCDKYSIS